MAIFNEATYENSIIELLDMKIQSLNCWEIWGISMSTARM